MGCCSSHTPILISQHITISENEEKIKAFITSSQITPQTINNPIAILNGITLNPLAYALWCGKCTLFKYLKEALGASIAEMEQLLENQNQSGLEIIMSKGHTDLLKYYLHEYLLSCKRKIADIQHLKAPLIQLSVANGHFDIVNYVYSYFMCSNPPPVFNVHYVNIETGENSALVACRCCNLPMVRLLNEYCNADFSIRNAYNQSALQLAVIGAREGQDASELVKYLIERCNVDISHEYEKVLGSVKDENIIEYLRKSLTEFGISTPEISFSTIYASNMPDIEKMLEESKITLGTKSSISFIEPARYLTFSILQEEI